MNKRKLRGANLHEMALNKMLKYNNLLFKVAINLWNASCNFQVVIFNRKGTTASTIEEISQVSTNSVHISQRYRGDTYFVQDLQCETYTCKTMSSCRV